MALTLLHLALCHETLTCTKGFSKSTHVFFILCYSKRNKPALPVSSHNPDLHGHPSDPALHISCFVAIALPDRCQVCPSSAPHPQGLSDGSVAVQVSAPDLSHSWASLWVCWGYMATRHSPGTCLMPKETPHKVCYDPNGKPHKSLEHTRFSFMWDWAERVGKEMLN